MKMGVVSGKGVGQLAPWYVKNCAGKFVCVRALQVGCC